MRKRTKRRYLLLAVVSVIAAGALLKSLGGTRPPPVTSIPDATAIPDTPALSGEPASARVARQPTILRVAADFQDQELASPRSFAPPTPVPDVPHGEHPTVPVPQGAGELLSAPPLHLPSRP